MLPPRPSRISNLVIDLNHRLQRIMSVRHGHTSFNLIDAIAKFLYLAGDDGECFRERVIDLLGISDHHAFAFPEDNVRGDSHDGRVRRNTAQDNRSSADAAVVPDMNITEDLGTSADDDAVTNGGMPFLAAVEASAAERDTLIYRDVVTDFGRLADYDSHAMIDKQMLPNSRSRMNFNAGQKSRHL